MENPVKTLPTLVLCQNVEEKNSHFDRSVSQCYQSIDFHSNNFVNITLDICDVIQLKLHSNDHPKNCEYKQEKVHSQADLVR